MFIESIMQSMQDEVRSISLYVASTCILPFYESTGENLYTDIHR